MLLQRLANSGYVAVTEDAPNSREERSLAPVSLDKLTGEKVRQGLRRCESPRHHPPALFAEHFHIARPLPMRERIIDGQAVMNYPTDRFRNS